MFDRLYAQMPVLLLIFVRLVGMIGFNPLLNRRNFPAMARAGLISCMTLLVAMALPAAPYTGDTSWGLVVDMAQELLLGLACGCVFQIFYYMLIFAGDQLDMAFGLSMARAFDPGTNIQMSVSGNFLNLLFSAYLFASNGHLTLIRLFSSSFRLLPPGAGIVWQNLPRFVIEIFIYAFALAFQLALPFVAMELILEFAVGILMKFIPQINVFVVNIQLKVLLGIGLLFLLAPATGDFILRYIDTLLHRLQDLLLAAAG